MLYEVITLQVGQFESTAELMDQWLTWTYLEGGGGGGRRERGRGPGGHRQDVPGPEA